MGAEILCYRYIDGKVFLKEFDYLSFIFNGERNEKKSKSFMGDSSNDENEINVPKGMGSKFACIFSVVMQMDLCWLNSIIRGIQKQNTWVMRNTTLFP